MEPFTVLGKWYMPSYVANGYSSTRAASRHGPFYIDKGWEHRPPYDNRDVVRRDAEVTGWHQDDYGSVPTLIIWSNIYPTEVLLPSGEIVSGEDNDVVLVDNRIAYHRISKDYVKAVKQGRAVNRHFMRSGSYSVPTSSQILAWKSELAS